MTRHCDEVLRPSVRVRGLRNAPHPREDVVGIRAVREANIELVYFDCAGYRGYRLPYPPFEHRVSILDLLLSEGPDAWRHMLSF